MDFISNKQEQIEEMLKVIGVGSIEELLEDIPKNLQLPPPAFDDGLSEYDGMGHMQEIVSKNSFAAFDSYLGAGAYQHHIPALVPFVCGKSEFLTAYTPYQAEASQGMLQIIFEFQSAICALTGMDASNASVYDGASACAEALLMALRVNKNRSKILVARSVHPNYRDVVIQYLKSHTDVEYEEIPCTQEGAIDILAFEKLCDVNTAAVLVQSPNFFGSIEDVKKISTLAKRQGVLTVLCSNPIAYGLYKSAKTLGADIAVGDCQPFGIPLQFGGPYAGYMACRQDLVRQLPGRIAGETVDLDGKKGYVLTLQAREQHIRREKATSNICTNQALAALASLVSMLWYGKEGVKKLALTNFQRASFLKAELEKFGFKTCNQTIFNEFLVKLGKSGKLVQDHFRKYKIEPGLDIARFYPDLEGYFLVCVTEIKSLKALNRYLEAAKQL